MSPYRAPAPIIRIATPRAVPVKAPKHRRRGGKGKGAGAGSISPVEGFVGAVILGQAEKSGILDKLPELPMVGRKGAGALVLYYWGKHGGGPMARKGAVLLAIAAGLEFGKEGKITGAEVDGEED